MKGVSKIIVMGILLASIMMAVQSARRASSFSSQISFTRCMQEDRCTNNPCNERLTETCVCRNDGTCAQERTSFCDACQDPDVYGVMVGMCQDQFEAKEPIICVASSTCTCSY